MSYRHEPRQFLTFEEAEKVSNVLIKTECHLMIFRGGIFFFDRAVVEQMHFQSSSLVLPSKTCNWFNFQLVVKVKPGDSIYFASSSYFRSAECGVFKGTARGARASSKLVECKLEQLQ